MKMKSSLEIEFLDEKTAKAAEKAVAHEGMVGQRSYAEVKRKGRKLTISINADDVVAMRATVNSFMREFQIFESLEKGNL